MPRCPPRWPVGGYSLKGNFFSFTTPCRPTSCRILEAPATAPTATAAAATAAPARVAAAAQAAGAIAAAAQASRKALVPRQCRALRARWEVWNRLFTSTAPPAAAAAPATAAAAPAAAASERSTLRLDHIWRLPERPPHIPEAVWTGLKRGLHLSSDNPIGITAGLVKAFFRGGARGPLLCPLQPSAAESASAAATTAAAVAATPSSPKTQNDQHQQLDDSTAFVYLDGLSPVVSVRENFDSLLIKASHCSRSTSDTYYLDPTFSLSHEKLASSAQTQQLSNSNRLVLRTHSTAHQASVLGLGLRRAVWSGAVARRDQVDSTHFPVFHQIDGICIFGAEEEGEVKENSIETLTKQHAALLRAVSLAKQQQQQRQQQQQAEEGLRVAFVGACAAAGLRTASILDVCEFECLADTNPFRANPVVLHLQITLEKLVRFLWAHKPPSVSVPSSSIGSGSSNSTDTQSNITLRWVYDAYFPFTAPSLELEVFHDGKWLEVLGAGEIRSEIIMNASANKSDEIDERQQELLLQLPHRCNRKKLLPSERGWAFGMGIERLAMLMFSVDDIRLLWSEDPRFTQQFCEGKVKAFVPYSHMPPVYKDISFWLAADACTQSQPPSTSAHTTEEISRSEGGPHGPACFDIARFYEVCREEAGAWIEAVTLKDEFTHPHTGRRSMCFRLTYKALDRTLTHREVNAAQDRLVAKLKRTFAIELR